MKLRELIPHDFGGFIKREVRPCAGYGLDPECSVVSPHTEHEWHVPAATIADADGLWLLCPKCFKAHGGARGTHAIILWRPRVPQTVTPVPGRWEFVGTSLDDITLVAGSSSILIDGACRAHFWIRNGQIADLT